ncbi:hypothetical protein [Mycolicibacterium fortuitum]|uniref:hypothetical protein n=1 Tax=Mycolicibacterium fortuitum TaxID=1766 RepID=UPI0013F5E2AD|nr:hypothetical protein [Mycolicibacterium fortuitum]
MSVINSEAQAKAIIRSATGVMPGEHTEALEIAEQLGNTLIEAAAFLRNLT